MSSGHGPDLDALPQAWGSFFHCLCYCKEASQGCCGCVVVSIRAAAAIPNSYGVCPLGCLALLPPLAHPLCVVVCVISCRHVQGLHSAMDHEGFWAARGVLGTGSWQAVCPSGRQLPDLHRGEHVRRARQLHGLCEPGGSELRDHGAAVSRHTILLQSRRPGALHTCASACDAKAKACALQSCDDMCSCHTIRAGLSDNSSIFSKTSRLLRESYNPDTAVVQDLGYSSEHSFVTPPAVGSDTTVKFLAVADLGHAQVDGSEEVSASRVRANATYRNDHSLQQVTCLATTDTQLTAWQRHPGKLVISCACRTSCNFVTWLRRGLESDGPITRDEVAMWSMACSGSI